MEHFGDRWWSYCGAVYMVHATKRVQGIKLIGAAWKEKKRSPVAVLQPSAHRMHDQRCPDLVVDSLADLMNPVMKKKNHGDA